MTMPNVTDAVWRAAIDDLVRQQVVQRRGYWLHLPEHRITLGEREQRLALALRSAIDAGRFDPPWVRELAVSVRASDDEVRLVLRKCVARGEVYQIVRDLFYCRGRVRELAAVLRGLVQQRGAVEAGAFRDAIGVGRKRTIQILEFFDRIGYTRRTLNARLLRTDSGWHDED
jgi:selenocysteine-specific elongation factor